MNSAHRRVRGIVTSLLRRGVAELFAYTSEERGIVCARLHAAEPPVEPLIQEETLTWAAFPFDPSEVPDGFDPDFCALVEGHSTTLLCDVQHLGACLDEPPLDLTDKGCGVSCALDHDLCPERSLGLFALACGWVETSARRLTVSRTVPLPAVNLQATFGSYEPVGNSRAFLRMGRVSYVGLSPELLALGTLHGFSSFKLSGTASAGDLSGGDMATDPRLVREHSSSIGSATAALSHLGTVIVGSRGVLRLPELKHFETELRCTPRPGASTRECIDAVRPLGAFPGPEGLRQISRIEGVSRGLYYGLVGYCLPDGRFEFSQVLRTIFCIEGRCSTRVGAAITALSTPALELEETRIKLASIHFVPR